MGSCRYEDTRFRISHPVGPCRQVVLVFRRRGSPRVFSPLPKTPNHSRSERTASRSGFSVTEPFCALRFAALSISVSSVLQRSKVTCPCGPRFFGRCAIVRFLSRSLLDVSSRCLLLPCGCRHNPARLALEMRIRCHWGLKMED